MVVKIWFNESEGRASSFSENLNAVRDKEGNKIGDIREFSESELNRIIPDSFEETDWKEVREHYKLNKDGELVFDEGYEPETENKDDK